MGFFDSIVNAADSFGAKVSGNVDAMGINSQVSSKEKEMNDLFAQLGAAYYSIHKDDPDDACRNLVQLLINKEAELAKLKNDLAVKKAETAAISYKQSTPAQNFGQPGQYQQPMGQGMNQPYAQQPMGQGMNQPYAQQPMGQGMNQPYVQQPAGQGMGMPVVPVQQQEPVSDTKTVAADSAGAKTCSKCGATGQSGAFCGNCGNKLD